MIGPSAPSTAASLARHIDYRGRSRRAALRARLSTVLATFGDPVGADEPTVALLRRLETALRDADANRLWLTLAVLEGELPERADVLRAVRATKLDGPLSALAHSLRSLLIDLRQAPSHWPDVKVITSGVVVDVHHTSQTTFATGIQRVARQSAVRWDRDHEPRFLGWTDGYVALRELTGAEVDRALHGTDLPPGTPARQVVVPWGCTYVLPELLAEPPRARRLQAMVEFSGATTGVIGFDCVPLTSSETTAYGMSGGYALNLAAVAQMDRVATISQAAATEYGGWRTMLRGTGLTGPEIRAVSLAVEASTPTEEALTEARRQMIVLDQPMLLVVGSHEPRKNHLAVLHAAELLWREGLRFTLNFVGGNSWSGERFTARLAQLQADGRPVQSISALSDELLWAAYRLARFTLFPSYNEGFGLPVAESLASGTPVITSNFGSMREIAVDGGALLVDPRDDHAVADAMRRLLVDDSLLTTLRTEAATMRLRSWDDYAEQVWQYLVNGAVDAPVPGTRTRGAVPA